MIAGAGDGGGDRRREVAISDELDTRAGLADVLDQLLVPLALEDDDGEILHVSAEAVRDDAQVGRDGELHAHFAGGRGTNTQLLHIDVGRMEQSAALGNGKHADRAVAPGSDEVGAFERVDGDVYL